VGGADEWATGAVKEQTGVKGGGVTRFKGGRNWDPTLPGLTTGWGGGGGRGGGGGGRGSEVKALSQGFGCN